MLKEKLQCFDHLIKRPWFWERLKAGGEGDDRGWDGWMASLTQWTWVWVNYESWWQTGRPVILQSMGSQRVRHDWATELNWTELNTFWAQNKRPYLRALVPLPSLYMGCTCLVIRDLSSVATGGELTHPSSFILHFWDSHRTPAPVNRFFFK